MGTYLERLPEHIREHISAIVETSGMPDNEETRESLAKCWLEKKRIFEENIRKFGMEEVDSFVHDDTRGALAMTYSGSLVRIGPIVNDFRMAQYASIGIRTDVPDIAGKEESKLAQDLKIGSPLRFEPGPVKKTSPIFKIAVLTGNPSIQEQEEIINEVTLLLQEEFTRVNKTVVSDS